MKLLKIFIWGFAISFVGSLPPATLNVASMQISVQESVRNALYFTFGCLLLEMVFVRISLVGIKWLQKQKKLFKWMEWITFALIVVLALGSFVAAGKEGESKNVVLNNDVPRFLLGLGMRIVSPTQIPYWFGWSTILYSKKILKPKNNFYNLYIIGIGLGTLLGNCVYIFGGKYVVEKLHTNQSLLNYIIGGVFSVTAIILLIRIITKKDSAEKLGKMF